MQPNLNGSVETMEIVSGASSQQAAGIQPSQSARIEVIGVGGGGSNAVNRMILSDLEGVAYRVLNTDAQALIQSQAQLVPGSAHPTLADVRTADPWLNWSQAQVMSGQLIPGSAGSRSQLEGAI